MFFMKASGGTSLCPNTMKFHKEFQKFFMIHLVNREKQADRRTGQGFPLWQDNAEQCGPVVIVSEAPPTGRMEVLQLRSALPGSGLWAELPHGDSNEQVIVAVTW